MEDTGETALIKLNVVVQDSNEMYFRIKKPQCSDDSEIIDAFSKSTQSDFWKNLLIKM